MATRSLTNFLVVHCAATRPDQDIGAREIDAMHRGIGWSGIGYHGVVRRDGSFEPGRSWDAIGTHVKGYNSQSVGVCLIGGLDSLGRPAPEYEPVQFATLRLLLDGLRKRYPLARVLGHRDFSPDLDGDGLIEPSEYIKACPSYDAALWYRTGEVHP